MLAAVMCNTWTAGTDVATDTAVDFLKQGVTVPTFGIEKGFTDIGQYIEYVGCAVNTLAISISTDAIITGTLGIIGAGVAGTDAYSATPAVGATGTPYRPRLY